MNARRLAQVVAVCSAVVVAAACGSVPDRPAAQSQVTVKYDVSPAVKGGYQVISDGPIDSQPLTSEQFRRELVQASAECDPAGAEGLSERLTLTQSGRFADGIKVVIHIAGGKNSAKCADTAADAAVGLLRSSAALRSLRSIENTSPLTLSGTVTQRP